MKLSVHIIEDRLQGYILESKTSNSWERTLRGCKVCLDTPQSFSDSHLYIFSAMQLRNTPPEQLPKAIIVAEDAPLCALNLSEETEILRVSTDTNLMLLWETVLQIFEEYDEWQRELNDALLEKMDAQHILDICSKVFPNPVLIKDTASFCFAWAGSIPKKLNSLWESILTTHYAEIPATANYAANKGLDRSTLLGPEPNLHTLELPDGVATLLYSNIFLEGKFMGCFAMDDIVAPITLGARDLSVYVAQKLSSLFRNIQYYPREPDALKHLLQRNLPKDVDSFSTIRMLFLREGIMPDDGLFRIALLTFSNDLSEYTNNYYDRVLCTLNQEILATCRTVNSSHALLCTSKFDPVFFLRENLQGMNAVIGLSVCMDKCSIHSMFLQAGAAIETGQTLHPDKTVFFFEDYSVANIARICLNYYDIASLCHPFAVKLFLFDAVNQTEYLPTLEALSLCDGNKTKTAEQLHIHRNTINYRIGKMCEILKLFDSRELLSADMFYLHLSCKIISYYIGSNKEKIMRELEGDA